jgi:hypothetical protein
MASLNIKMTLFALTAASLIAGPTAAAAANVMVVRSAGPSAKTFPPGKTIPSSSKIALQAGDLLVILGSSSARTLRGPGTFSASPVAKENLAMAANKRARFGALRSSDYPQNPSPWNVDVSKGGKMCILDPGKLTLWRPDTIDTIQLNIKPAGGAGETVQWAAGQATLRWPSSLPVTDGVHYQVQAEGADPIDLSFVTIPGNTSSDMVTAAQTLIDKGCDSQLDALVEGVSKDQTQ